MKCHQKCLAASLFAIFSAAAIPAHALSNSGRIPVLLYHTWLQSGCDYSSNAIIAMQTDLETLHSRGWTVIPAYWAAQWVIGDRDGSTVPEKVVAITFDDGPDQDWYDSTACGYLPSGYTVLANFKAAHPSLPSYSPHASTFVISSPVARGMIGGQKSDWWWSAQNASNNLMEVYNHSVDHDHSNITSQQWDPFMFTYMAVGGYEDGNWAGTNNFMRINTYQESDIEVRKSGDYISGIIGVYPDLFAYPFGHASAYLKGTYFPNYASEHKTYAAFCLTDNAALRGGDRFCIPRFTYGDGTANVWTTSNQFIVNVLGETP